MVDDLNEARRYIRRQRAKGEPDKRIHDQLRGAGWDDAQLEALFGEQGHRDTKHPAPGAAADATERPHARTPLPVLIGGVALLLVFYLGATALYSRHRGPAQGSLGTATFAEYQRLREGMSYKEACRIIGGRGRLESRIEQQGGTADLYVWEAPGDIGPLIGALFFNDRLISKNRNLSRIQSAQNRARASRARHRAQKPAGVATIRTAGPEDRWDQIRRGMTEQQVCSWLSRPSERVDLGAGPYQEHRKCLMWYVEDRSKGFRRDLVFEVWFHNDRVGSKKVVWLAEKYFSGSGIYEHHDVSREF